MDSDNPKKIDISHYFAEENSTFDYYSCEQAINRLNAYLDHELNSDEFKDVVKHLQICKPCLEHFHFEEQLIVAIRTRFSDVGAPDALKVRLREALQSESTPKKA